MKISYIKEFLILAEMCNYSRAANALFISQTSLFNHIKALEQELGVLLFERSGKKIIISEYGQMFLPYARMIINAAECYVKDISEKKSDASRAILVGTQYRIMDLTGKFRSAYKDYMIHTLDSKSVEESLYKDGCELAFIRNLEEQDGKYNAIPYINDSMVVTLYRSHPLAKRKSLTLDELKKQYFVVPSPLKKREDDIISLCRRAGFVPKVVMTVLTGSDVARAVNDELGISLLLKKTILSEKLDNIVFVDLMPKVECNVSLCWRKDIILSEGARKFVEFVKQLNQHMKLENEEEESPEG